MKIEQLLVQHFYISREITLQGMGTFTLSPDFVLPKENDKDAEIPDNAITFQYNPKATADDALISYIVQQTRKMKALAAADLDSYLVLGKQFLNIGKPFKIDGMGMLVKTQQGDLEFTKGGSFHSKMESTPAAVKEKKENPEISFASESKPTPGNNKAILIGSIIIILGLLAASAWYFLSKTNNVQTVNNTVPVIKDSIKIDTANPVIVAPVVNMPKVTDDGYTFKVIILVTKDSAVAVKRMNVLTARNHKVIMYTNDSLGYKLAEPFTLPLTDTARIRDSLNKYYYVGKAFIEL